MEEYSFLYTTVIDLENHEMAELNQHKFKTMEEAVASNYTFSFLDQTLYRKANIKAYIPSNEKSNHHVPHIHIEVNKDMTYVFSLIDFILIHPKHGTPTPRELYRLLNDKIQLFREGWNDSNSVIKFERNHDGSLSNTLTKN